MNCYNGLNELYQLNTNIGTGKKVCIFGTGIDAKRILTELAEKNIHVDFFADRTPISKKIKNLFDRPVLSEDELINMDCIVIIVSTFWEEISDRLLKKGINNILIAPIISYDMVVMDEQYLFAVGDVNFKKDIMYICCSCPPYGSAGSGDTLYVAALVKSYKEAHPMVKKVCLIVPEKYKELVARFSAVDEIIASKSLVSALTKYSRANGIWKRCNYIYGHFTNEWLKNESLGLYKGRNLVSCFKEFVMDLPELCELEYPQFQQTYQNDDIDKNTIILMPYAVSVIMLPEFFWEELGRKLVELGFNVYTNIKDESEKVITGTKKISEPIDRMAQICEKSFAVISLRSGMCDILSMTNTTLLIINPQEYAYNLCNIKDMVRKVDIYNFNYFEDNDIESLEKNILCVLEEVKCTNT